MNCRGPCPRYYSVGLASDATSDIYHGEDERGFGDTLIKPLMLLFKSVVVLDNT